MLVTGMFSCSDGNEFDEEHFASKHYLSISIENVLFNRVGGERQLEVSSNALYNVKVYEGDWLKVVKKDNAVLIVAESNNTGKQRIGKIVLFVTEPTNVSLTREVKVVQQTGVYMEGHPYGEDQRWDKMD